MGATSGIGLALVVHFSNLNFNVLAVARNEIELARTKALSSNASNIVSVMVDLSKKSAGDVVAEKLSSTDKVRFLIHCAATCEPLSPLLDVTEDQMSAALAVNVMAPLALMKKLKPFFTDATRTLFFGSDYVGKTGKIRENITGVYGIAKSALDVAIAYLQRENKNLLIGSVNPGPTNTRMFQSVITAAGLFNSEIQSADPMIVAVFVYAILMKTSNASFVSEKWDFRNRAHHDFLSIDEAVSSCVENPASKMRSKL